jgi:hypothetical protein
MSVRRVGLRWATTYLVVACAWLTVAAVGASGETRNPSTWPFAASSPWNSSLGTGASYGDTACDQNVAAEGQGSTSPWINTTSYSMPVYWASNSDPSKTVYEGTMPNAVAPNGQSRGQYHVPNAATPSNGTDRDLDVIEPSNLVSDEMWNTYNNLLFVDTGNFSRHDLVNGDGFTSLGGFGPRAANASTLGGLLRTWELQAGQIRHVLALSLSQSRMTPAYVAPASSIDNNHSGYTGTIRMGQLFALPPSVDINALGLTTSIGRVVAQALKTYGAYVVDTGGGLSLYADPGADSLVDPARKKDGSGESDLRRIVRSLRCVTNNAPPTWGGGGTPLAPPPPPFG